MEVLFHSPLFLWFV